MLLKGIQFTRDMADKHNMLDHLSQDRLARSMRRPQPGQNLVEFVLPTALISITAIVLVMGVQSGGGFLGWISGTTMGGQSNQAVQVKPMGRLVSDAMEAQALSNMDPMPGDSSGLLKDLPSQVLTLRLADGSTFPITLVDPNAAAEAAGGNGITEAALSALDQLIKELREKNPEDARIPVLAELSARGHKIKAAQALLTSKFPPGGFKDSRERNDFLKNTRVVFEGKEQSLLDLAGQMNWFYNRSKEHNRHADEYAYGANPGFYENYRTESQNDPDALINRFMDQMVTVRNSSVMDDPAIGALVDDVLAKQIYLSSTQTLFVPTKEDSVKLVDKTKMGANFICKISRFIQCGGESQSNVERSADVR